MSVRAVWATLTMCGFIGLTAWVSARALRSLFGEMRVMIERIKEAQPQTHLTSTFLGCLTAMTNGDVTAITGEHWGNAFRSGGITAVVATVAVGVGFRVNQWTRAVLCGVATFGVEMIAQSPSYGISRADIAQTSLVAAGSSGASSMTDWSFVTAICSRVAPSSNERAAS